MNSTKKFLQVKDQELLARFVFFARYIRNNGTIKHNAFLPNTKLEILSTSVFRHVGLNETDLWEIGDTLAIERSRPLYGRADLLANDVRKQNLKIEPTAMPPNHANITGWPPEKEKQLLIASELAQKAWFLPR